MSEETYSPGEIIDAPAPIEPTILPPVLSGTMPVIVIVDGVTTIIRDMTDEEVAAKVPVVITSATPALTRRQLRLGMLNLGVTTAQIEDLIAALPEPQKSIALIEWQDATIYERNHPLVGQIASALSLSNETMDAAWAASALL